MGAVSRAAAPACCVVSRFGFRVSGFGFRASGFGFRGSGFNRRNIRARSGAVDCITFRIPLKDVDISGPVAWLLICEGQCVGCGTTH